MTNIAKVDPRPLDATTPAAGSLPKGGVDLARLASVVAWTLAGLVVAGTLALRLPQSVEQGLNISWLDSLFLATSAACGNGLATLNPADTLSPFGWVVVSILIEAGLLLYLVLGAAVVDALNAGVEPQRALPRWSFRTTAIAVATWMIATQAVGTLAMLPFIEGGAPVGERVAFCMFHAVSAFGHAGFSTVHAGLVAYRYSALVHLILVPLMVLGGVGFPVLRNVAWVLAAPRVRRLTAFSRLALGATAALYLAGVVTLTAPAIVPYFYEELQLGTTSNMPNPGPLTLDRAGAAVADASFLSVAARGAGLATQPTGELPPASLFVVLTLAVIGGVPGGAGGGLFAVTLAVAVVAVNRKRRGSTLRSGVMPLSSSAGLESEAGHAHEDEGMAPQLSRACGQRALDLAVAVAMPFLALLFAGIFLLSLFEPYPFIKIAFEAVSAASSNGYSLGITGDLTRFSKAVLIVLMFVGRLMPISVLAWRLRVRHSS